MNFAKKLGKGIKAQTFRALYIIMGRCHGRSSYSAKQTAKAKFPIISYTGNYETAFYDHHFIPSTYGKYGNQESEFAPRFSLCRRVIDTVEEFWFGLNFISKFDGNGLSITSRPKLNLAIVLDVSGSMVSVLGKSAESKISIAKKNLLQVTQQLKDTDTITFITFNTEPNVVQKLEKWGNLDHVAFSDNVNALKAGGGTELSKALIAASDVLREAEESTEPIQNRILLLTDMEANRDEDEADFVLNAKKLSQDGIYTTIVGIGMDLARVTVQDTSKTPGCNYCNVRAVEHFQHLMEKEFNFLVTPIAFDVQLKVKESSPWEITRGYGSPEISNVPLDEIRFSSIFPSSMDDIGTGLRSGCYLFKLERKTKTETPTGDSEDFGPLSVEISWFDGSGSKTVVEEEVSFSSPVFFNSEIENDPDTIINCNGLRKCLLLKDYTDFSRSNILKYNEAVKNNAMLPSESAIVAFMETIEQYKEELRDETLQIEIDTMNNILTSVQKVAADRG